MGDGGRMNDVGSTKVVDEKAQLALKRVPVSKPPFELSDLKKAIPPHCFKRSVVRSFLGLFRDLIIVAALSCADVIAFACDLSLLLEIVA
nr:delta(12) fatty acid desaturase DES8.11-like [Tanacetum cinerariifolium]